MFAGYLSSKVLRLYGSAEVTVSCNSHQKELQSPYLSRSTMSFEGEHFRASSGNLALPNLYLSANSSALRPISRTEYSIISPRIGC
jgi:hypothetical protein